MVAVEVEQVDEDEGLAGTAGMEGGIVLAFEVGGDVEKEGVEEMHNDIESGEEEDGNGLVMGTPLEGGEMGLEGGGGGVGVPRRGDGEGRAVWRYLQL